MARKAREEVEAGIFHVYARGNEKREIFRCDLDRFVYLQRLGVVVARQRWRCLSYCLMPNHVHLLVETVVPNLGAGVRLVHGPYAQEFNRRHDRVGHLFQGRYGAVRVTDDRQLATTVGYIASNPVVSGLVAEPVSWPWGSHRALVAAHAAPPWLATTRLYALLAGALGGDGRRAYDELLAARLSAGHLPRRRTASGGAASSKA